MFNIKTNFYFNPVGQGLFYQGEINDFKFVYDCGGDPLYLNKCLEKKTYKKY